MLDCSIIEIGCECGHNQKIDRDFQKKIFGGEIKISDLTNFYKKFKCTKCDKKNPDVFDSNKNQLFDKSNFYSFEPSVEAFKTLKSKYGNSNDVKLFNTALGFEKKKKLFY